MRGNEKILRGVPHKRLATATCQLCEDEPGSSPFFHPQPVTGRRHHDQTSRIAKVAHPSRRIQAGRGLLPQFPRRRRADIDRQREQVRKWAEKHGLEIVREFEDRDTSALDKQPRPGFGELKEWVKQDRDLRYILCRDPSRWCRFVDNDLAVSYYRKCLKAGRRVVYTIFDMPPEADSLYSAFFTSADGSPHLAAASTAPESSAAACSLRRGERGRFPEGSGDAGAGLGMFRPLGQSS